MCELTLETGLTCVENVARAIARLADSLCICRLSTVSSHTFIWMLDFCIIALHNVSMKITFKCKNHGITIKLSLSFFDIPHFYTCSRVVEFTLYNLLFWPWFRFVAASWLSKVLSQLCHVGGASPTHPGIPSERVSQVSHLWQGVHQCCPTWKTPDITQCDQAFQLWPLQQVLPGRTRPLSRNAQKATVTWWAVCLCLCLCLLPQQLSGLWYHNRTNHPDVFASHTRQLKNLVQCDICFKFFPTTASLAKHQAAEHQGEHNTLW